jgi:hypothetical protein
VVVVCPAATPCPAAPACPACPACPAPEDEPWWKDALKVLGGGVATGFALLVAKSMGGGER